VKWMFFTDGFLFSDGLNCARQDRKNDCGSMALHSRFYKFILL
jgi:hypothetical protein